MVPLEPGRRRGLPWSAPTAWPSPGIIFVAFWHGTLVLIPDDFSTDVQIDDVCAIVFHCDEWTQRGIYLVAKRAAAVPRIRLLGQAPPVIVQVAGGGGSTMREEISGNGKPFLLSLASHCAAGSLGAGIGAATATATAPGTGSGTCSGTAQEQQR